MKLPKNILIEKATSADPTRPVLASVYLDKPEGGPARLLATNGRIAAIVPVLTEEHDAAGYIPAEALKAARKAAGKLEAASFTANGTCTMPDGQTFARPTPGNFPKIDGVIPKGETVYSVALDPELLLAVAQAIGAERGVLLEFSAETGAIRVRPHINTTAESPKGTRTGYAPACPDALGLLMPIKKAEAAPAAKPATSSANPS